MLGYFFISEINISVLEVLIWTDFYQITTKPCKMKM